MRLGFALPIVGPAISSAAGHLEPGASVDSVADKLENLAGSGAAEAIVDAFALFPTLDQMLDFAGQVIARWSDRGKV